MTRVLLSPFIITVWTPVVLAIIKHFLGHVENVYDDDDDDDDSFATTYVEVLTSRLDNNNL